MGGHSRNQGNLPKAFFIISGKLEVGDIILIDPDAAHTFEKYMTSSNKNANQPSEL